MARFDRQIQTAIRLIKKNGQTVTWQKGERPIGSTQPWKQESNEPQQFEVIICFFPANKENQQTLNYIRGTEVAFGSMVGLMASVAFIPSLGDFVVRDGVTLKIKSIDLLAPNGQKILYTIEFEQ